MDRSGLLQGELESVIKRWIDTALSQDDEHRPSYDEMLQHTDNQMLACLMELHDHRPTRLPRKDE